MGLEGPSWLVEASCVGNSKTQFPGQGGKGAQIQCVLAPRAHTSASQGKTEGQRRGSGSPPMPPGHGHAFPDLSRVLNPDVPEA